MTSAARYSASRSPRTGKPLRLHRHQADAVEAARSGDNYVLTTGTGSGKSLAYIVPIVDYVLRQRQRQGHPGHRRLPDERPRQQPEQRAGEVPLPGISAGEAARSPSGATRARRRTRSARRSWPIRPTSC